ncbi:hypothetical protein GMLC_40870 [Geomonas limicola]|uniref:STAS domain-containing protein n=1 Tax=Geomonas limicola TaxID=2740186 RepID=A0A6V8NCZ5_9BACT|nr:STAS domain-containing protein [Geomonas limicola]GFO70508.1 hypothetical protein GMLC_40870 [Geomonas limicola]
MVRWIEQPGARAGELTLSLRGDAQFTQVADLERELQRALARCQLLTLDLSGVQRLDSSICALLCVLHRQGELAGKELRISGLPPRGVDVLHHLAGCSCRHQPGEGCRLRRALRDPRLEATA